MSRSRGLSPAAQLALDAALALWTIAWVCMGFAVAHEVRGIADLSDTVGSVGRAVASVGAVSSDPLADVRAGNHSALADAELEWHGLLRSRRPSAHR